MDQAAEADLRRERRRKLAPFWVPLLFGLLSLVNLVGKPRLATLHASDVVQLLGTGMCFGVAVASLVAFLRGPRTS
jgi:hypothetical protein